MPEKEMTYEELYRLFKQRNQDSDVLDYRPAPGEYRIQIWLNGNLTFYVRYIPELDRFVFSKVDQTAPKTNFEC